MSSMKMNSKAKGIIIAVVFLLCMVVVLLALKLTEPSDNSSSDDSNSSVAETADTYIYQYEKSDVVEIVVTNSNIDERYNGQFTVKKLDDETFSVAEAEEFTQATSYTSAIANCASAIKYNALVEENAENLAKYGLAEPIAEFTVSFDDGTSRSVCIGSESPVAGYNYVCEKGKNTVYTVLASNLYYFTATPETFVRLLLVAAPSDDAWPHIDSLTITRDDLPTGEVVIVTDDTTMDDDAPITVAAQMIASPVNAYLDVTNSSAVSHGIWGLTAAEVVILNPDEVDLGAAGIDKPTAVVEYVCDGGELTYKLIIGAPYYMANEDGSTTTTVEGYYGYLEGIDAVMKFTAESVPWASFTIESIASPMITSNYINSIDFMDIEITDGENDASYHFELDYDEVAELLSVEMNGIKLDSSYFGDFYLFFLKCPADEIWIEDPVNPCRMTVRIVTTGGREDYLEFYKDTDRRTIVKLNGKTSFRQTTAYLDLMIENLAGMATGEKIETVW